MFKYHKYVNIIKIAILCIFKIIIDVIIVIIITVTLDILFIFS